MGRVVSYFGLCYTLKKGDISQQQGVELYRRERPNLWTYHAFGPEEFVELTCIKVRFPVTDMYENVIFSENAQ